MATKSSKQRRRKSDNAGFRISNGPVAQFADEERKSTPDFGDVADLPRAYGGQLSLAKTCRWIDKFISAFTQLTGPRSRAWRSNRWRGILI